MESHGYNHGADVYPGRHVGVAQQQHGPESRGIGAHPTHPAPVPTQEAPPLPAQAHGLDGQTLPPSQSADAVKEPSHHDNEPQKPKSIEPDTNPLTPTTPKFSESASTNMAIVLPPNESSHFSVSTFTPSPQAIRGGSWQHGLCSCGEPSTCFTGLLCPCLVYGKTQYRLGLRADKKDPTNMLGYTAVNGACIAFGLLCGFNGILAAIQHTRVRKTYNMNSSAGNVAGDCLKGLCCCCCVVAQDEKEVRFREEQARKPSGSGTKREGYLAPCAMTFSAPPPR